MNRLCLWVPWLLFRWQPVWLPVQATQPLESAQDLVQLTSSLPWLFEPWSSHSSESPDALTPPADPGGFDYLGSSAPSQKLALSKESTVSLVPSLDMDSVQELPPEPDQLTVRNKLTRQQRLSEVTLMPDGDQTQALALPLRLETKRYQSFPPLDSQNSKTNKLIVSSLSLKNDLAWHQQHPEDVTQTPDKPEKPQLQIMQSDYSEYPDSFPLELQESQAAPSQPSEQIEPSQVQAEGQTPSPENYAAIQSSPPQPEAQAPSPQLLEKDEPPSTQHLMPVSQLQPSETEASPTQQERPVQPQFATEEVGGQSSVYPEVNTPSLPQNAPSPENYAAIQSSPPQPEAQAPSPQPLEKDEPPSTQHLMPVSQLQPSETEASPTQQERPVQPQFATEEVGGQSSVYPEVNTPSLPQNAAFYSNSSIATPADMELTTMSEAVKEVQPIPSKDQAQALPKEVELTSTQQDPPVQTPGLPEEVESLTQEGLTQTSELSVENEPSSMQQDAPAQPSEYAVMGNPSTAQKEAPIQSPDLPVNTEYYHSKQPFDSPQESEPSRNQAEALEQPSTPPVEVKSLVQQETQTPATPTRNLTAQTPQIQEVTSWSQNQNQAYHYNLPSVTGKPTDMEGTVTSEPTTEDRPSLTQQEDFAQTPGPPAQTEASPREQEQPAQNAESPVENEPSSAQKEAPYQTPSPYLETQPSPTQEELPDQTPVPSAQMEPSLFQQEPRTPTLGPSVETEPALVPDEPLDQPSGPLTEVEASPFQQESLSFTPSSSVDTEPSNSEQDQIAQYAESLVQSQPPPLQHKSPAQPLGSTSMETEPSPSEQEQIAHFAESLVETQSAPNKHEASAHTLVPPQETELYRAHQDQSAQSSETSEAKSSELEKEAPVQPLDHHEITISPQVQHSYFSSVTTKPPDLMLTITAEPTAREGMSLIGPDITTQPSVLAKDRESSANQPQAPALPPEPLEEVEPLPAQPPEVIQGEKPPMTQQEEETVENLQSPENVVTEATSQQETQTQAVESLNEARDQPPEPQKVTSSFPGHDQLQPPTLHSVTLKPVQILTKPEAPAQSSITPTQPESLKHQEVVAAQQPNPTVQEVPVQPEGILKEPSPSQQENLNPHQVPTAGAEPTQEEYALPFPDIDDAISTTYPPLFRSQPLSVPKTTQKSVHIVLTIGSKATSQVYPSPSQQEGPAKLRISIGKVSQPSQASKLPEKVESSPAEPPKNLQKVKYFPMRQEVPANPQDFPKETELNATQQEFKAQQTNLSKVTVSPLNVVLTLTPQPIITTGELPLIMQKTQTLGTSKEGTGQPSLYQKVTLPTPANNKPQYPIVPSIQPLDLELTATPKPTTEGELSTSMQKTPLPLTETPTGATGQPPVYVGVTAPTAGRDQAQPSGSSYITIQSLKPLLNTKEPSGEGEQLAALNKTNTPHANLTLAMTQPLDLENTVTPETSSMATETSANTQEASIQPPEEGTTQYPTTVQPLNTMLTITPKPMMKADPSIALKKTTVLSPTYQEAALSKADQVQAQPPNMTEITVQPFDLELTLTPEPNVEGEPHSTMQETTAQSPKPPTEVVYQPPVFYEMAVPKPSENQTPVSPNAKLEPLKLEIIVTPTQPGHSTDLTAASPYPFSVYPEVILPETDQIQTQHTNLPQATVKPLDLEVTINPQYTKEVKPFTNVQMTRTQPPELQKVSAQSPVNNEMTVPIPGSDQARHSISPSATTQPLNTDLTRTSGPTTNLKRTTGRHSDQIETQRPNLPKVTGQPLSGKPTIAQYPVNYTPENTAYVQKQQNTTKNLCEICSCKDQTLSCVGLSPAQKLSKIPVLEAGTYNDTFITLNFQGNSISYIDESVWKSYRWAEKLILSENELTELHKDTFEGLTSIRHLDLSCNKIEFIERRAFESLPFVQSIDLRCNLLIKLSFGTFQAWHGMQFLHTINLNRNPLTNVEDPYLFKLPALKYLDLGTTQVTLTTVENLLMMTLQLESLILPSRLACCLCQFKNNIEVVCKTVKLHCDSECLANTTHCLEEASIGSPKGTFMKILQARKTNTSNELIIEPENLLSGKISMDLQGSMKELQDFTNERDVLGALNYVLPYFLEENLQNVESTLLPLIKLLFSNVQDGDKSLSFVKTHIRKPFPYKNKRKRLYFLEKMQQKTNQAKKDKKTAKLMQSTLLGPKFERQIFLRESETAPSEESSLEAIPGVEQRMQRVKTIIKEPKGLWKRHRQQRQKQGLSRRQSTQGSVESLAEGRLPGLQKPRQLEGNGFHREPLLTKEHELKVSPLLKKHIISRSSTPSDESLSEAKKKEKVLTDTIFVLEDANARTKNELGKPISHARHVHKTRSHLVLRTPNAKPSRKSKRKNPFHRLRSAKRPPFPALRSLINSPSQEEFSSPGDLSSQGNPFSEPSIENTGEENHLVGNAFQGNVLGENTTGPEETFSSNTILENPFVADPAGTMFKLTPTIEQDNETNWEYPNLDTGVPTMPKDLTYPLMLSKGEQLEIQLNQQLESLIPNSDVRRLISTVIRTLKLDCADPRVRLSCARLISMTGILMKLLSEQQEEKVAKEQWDVDQLRTDTYINESEEALSQQKEQKPDELKKEVPAHVYHSKLILAVSVTAGVMLLVIIFCLIEIYSHRVTAEEDIEKSLSGLSQRPSRTRSKNEGFFRLTWLLPLKRLFRSFGARRKKAKDSKPPEKTENKELSDTDAGEFSEVPAEKTPPTESAAEGEGEGESEVPEE